MYPLSSPAGSILNPFNTYEAASASYSTMTADLPWIVNGLSPLGKTQFFWSTIHDALIPIPGQNIALYRGVNGAPLLDMTATGRTPGTWYQLWSGDVIADWLLPNNHTIEMQARMDIKEASNTGGSQVALLLRANNTPIGDANNSIIARSATGSQYGNGVIATRVSTERRGGLFFGSGGLSINGQGDRSNSSFSTGSTRPVLDANFALTTNVLKLWYVSILSGV